MNNTLNEDDNDPLLPILQDIEGGLVGIYDSDPILTDASVMFALEIGKIAIKQAHGYAKSQNGTPGPEHQAVVRHVVATGARHIGKELTLDEYVKCIDKVKRSVERHRSHGMRGFHEFIRKFL